MKKANYRQFNNVMSILLNNVDPESMDSDLLHEELIKKPKETAELFVQWVNNGGRLILPEQAKILTIDRATPFDPANFKGLGNGWTVWKGSANGNGLEGEEDQDPRSLAITEIDLSQVNLEHMLTDEEIKSDRPYINGEEKHKRLKRAKQVRLDAAIWLQFWNNKHLIPEAWKKKTNGNTTFVFFDGTILRSPYGNRFILCLSFFDGEWYWYYYWLDNDFGASSPSPVLASIKNKTLES